SRRRATKPWISSSPSAASRVTPGSRTSLDPGALASSSARSEERGIVRCKVAERGGRASCLRARPLAHALVPGREVRVLRSIDADVGDLAEVDRAQRGDVGDREALARKVRTRGELAVEPVEAVRDALPHDRRELRRLLDPVLPEGVAVAEHLRDR